MRRRSSHTTTTTIESRRAIIAVGSIAISVVLFACRAFAIGGANDSPDDADAAVDDATPFADARIVINHPSTFGDAAQSQTTDANDSGGHATRCGNVYPFCDDFERSDITAANAWFLAANTGFFGIEEDGTAPSPSHSLVFHTTENQDASSWIGLHLNPATRRVRASFAMRIDDAITQIAQLVSIALTEQKYVLLQTVDGQLQLAEQDQTKDPSRLHGATAESVPAQWARYDLDIDLTAQTATLLRDGSPFQSINLTYDFSKPLDAFRVGFTYTEGGNEGSVRFDDFGVRED
jgi:hypothetical protein